MRREKGRVSLLPVGGNVDFVFHILAVGFRQWFLDEGRIDIGVMPRGTYDIVQFDSIVEAQLIEFFVS